MQTQIPDLTSPPEPPEPEQPNRRGSGNAVLRLLRPKQWTKNLLVFAALLFSAKLTDLTADLHSLGAFVAMCLASSATYIFNDIADRDKDKLHPRKRFRPIAAGEVSVTLGFALGVVLLVVAAAIAISVNAWVLAMIGFYLVLQVAYNGWLKKMAVADVFVIATGFVLRAALGAQAISVTISGWLLFCTGALSLMLGFAKRREEFISQAEEISATRSSLADYNRMSLDVMVAMFAGVAVMSYWIYCLDSPTAKHYPSLIATAPFVTYGVARYLLEVFVNNEGGEPADILLRDRHVIASVVGFLIAALISLSGRPIPIIKD